MLRVKVYEVDEHGEEKLLLDNEGNPVVSEGAGMVIATQTAEIMDDRIEAKGNINIIGEINSIAMGTLLKGHKTIRKFMTKAMLHETMNAMMQDDEEDEEKGAENCADEE